MITVESATKTHGGFTAVDSLGNLAGTATADVPTGWDQDLTEVGYYALGHTLLMLVGFTLGAHPQQPRRHRAIHGLHVRGPGAVRLSRVQPGLVPRRPPVGRRPTRTPTSMAASAVS